MRTQFTGTPPISEPEQALRSWGIPYETRTDGALVVHGDLNLSSKNLTHLPDLSAVSVGGNFSCAHNQLTSLRGAPQSVGGGFYCHSNQLSSLRHAPQVLTGSFICSFNQLTSLEYAPQSVGGDFLCRDNQLTSLLGAPRSVGGIFACHYNRLRSLEHAPQSVTEHFFCSSNLLTSLEHAPQSVGGEFCCHRNQLTSLEHAPQVFQKLKSDFGTFKSWNDVPEQLRLSPETRARLQQEWERAFNEGATVLQSSVRVQRPLKLKRMAPSDPPP